MNMGEEPSEEERKKYCQELSEFLENTDKYVREACAFLGWDFDLTVKDTEEYMLCPFNEGHRVPKRTLQKHLVKCEWNTLGYTKDCIPLPESVLPPESPSTIKFDMQLQQKVLMAAKKQNPELNIGDEEKLIPQTSDRLISDFTSDERKAMYEYVISNTVTPDIGEDIQDINKPEKSSETKSTPILELLAQERNLKRRRAKHKGIHTNKKSYTEILREIVEQQMEMYKEYISEKLEVSTTEKAEENSLVIDSTEIKMEVSTSERNAIKSSEDALYDYELENYKKQDYKNKYNAKSVENFDRNSKYFQSRSYNPNYKHYNNYKDYDSPNSSGKHNQDNYNSREKHDSKYYKNNDKRDYRDKKQDSASRSRKRSRSVSNEKRHNVESEYMSKEGRSSHKHKKHDKKKKERSCNTDEQKKHKSSKHKREKHRSRSDNRSN